MAAREHLARRTANELLDELSITSWPVDPEWIVRAKGLMFEERADFPPKVYGALFRSGNHFGVMVSDRCPTDGHRRFTISHELGHYHLPDHVDRLFVNGADVVPSLAGHFRGKDPLELEADYFASELLMPDRFVKPFVRQLGSGIVAIRAVADRYKASLVAAAIRFTGLCDDPTIILVSDNGTIEWAARSPSVWAHTWSRRSWKGEWAPRGSATQRLASAPERILQNECDDESMLLCEWFENAPNHVEVVEEAIGLGSYSKILTVLTISDLPDADEETEQESEDDTKRDWRDAMRTYRLG